MNNLTKHSSKGSSPPKVKSHQGSVTPIVKSNNNSSSISCENDGSTLLGATDTKDIIQEAHPMIHSSAELAEPPSTPPSIHPAAHRPSSLTAQSAITSNSGGMEYFQTL